MMAGRLSPALSAKVAFLDRQNNAERRVLKRLRARGNHYNSDFSQAEQYALHRLEDDGVVKNDGGCWSLTKAVQP